MCGGRGSLHKAHIQHRPQAGVCGKGAKARGRIKKMKNKNAQKQPNVEPATNVKTKIFSNETNVRVPTFLNNNNYIIENPPIIYPTNQPVPMLLYRSLKYTQP